MPLMLTLCLVRGSTEITVESTTEEVVSIERKGRGREWVLKYPITTAKSADDASGDPRPKVRKRVER